MDTDEPQVFLSGQYTYRGIGLGLAGLFFALGGWGFAGTVIVGGLYQKYQEGTPFSWGLVGEMAIIIPFVGGIGGFMGFAGASMLRAWWTRLAIRLEITSEGIRWGEKFHSWDQIDSVAIVSYDMGYVGPGHRDSNELNCVAYTIRTKMPSDLVRDCYAPLDVSLSPNQHRRFVRSLGRALRKSHPKVVVG